MLFTPALFRIGRRFLIRHPWQSVLMVLGIALGVAMVVAIDLANTSAERAFQLSTEAITGKATDQITGGPEGLQDSLYADLLRQGLSGMAAPVISETVTSPQLGNQPLNLLGIDPFAEEPFANYLGVIGALKTAELSSFLTKPGAVLLSKDLGDEFGIKPGAMFSLNVGGKMQPVFLSGLLEPADSFSRRTLSGLILADISTAQELTGRIGRLDRIDLILPSGDSSFRDRIDLMLPADASLTSAAARVGAIEQMTAAFHTNLTALSLLALLVGLFLIYNTMTFAVVQRRPLFGALRCLGVTRREIFSLIVGEALIVGIAGSLLGMVIGLALSRQTIHMVTQTINDLYFTTTVRDVGIAYTSLVKGGVLGVLATVLTSAVPALEASRVSPRLALMRSGLEAKTRISVLRVAIWGVGFIILGAAILLYPTRSLPLGFGGTFFVIAGFGMVAALATVGILKALQPILSGIFGVLGRMAPRNLVNALSRTSVAVAALMVAVAVTIGVSLMIGSFRYTVITWLSQTLQGDIYISGQNFKQTTTEIPIDPQIVKAASGFPGVARVDALRAISVASPSGPITLNASSNPRIGQERLYLAREGTEQEVQNALDQGAVLVSEPLANRLGIPKHGGRLSLYTPSGLRSFPVAGIYYDYSSSEGTTVMAMAVYRKFWFDSAVTSLSLRLASGVNPDQATRDIQKIIQQTDPHQTLNVRPNRALREAVLSIFDRTFAITGALNVITLIVAFIGVLSTLFLLQVEKQREVGVLRAIGLTIRQLWGLVFLETGLLGLSAGLLAIPTGYTLSIILIYIINRRSFGWTLQMALGAEPFLEALLVALAAALLAGIYPAYRLGKMGAAEAIRYE